MWSDRRRQGRTRKTVAMLGIASSAAFESVGRREWPKRGTGCRAIPPANIGSAFSEEAFAGVLSSDALAPKAALPVNPRAGHSGRMADGRTPPGA